MVSYKPLSDPVFFIVKPEGDAAAPGSKKAEPCKFGFFTIKPQPKPTSFSPGSGREGNTKLFCDLSLQEISIRIDHFPKQSQILIGRFFHLAQIR